METESEVIARGPRDPSPRSRRCANVSPRAESTRKGAFMKKRSTIHAIAVVFWLLGLAGVASAAQVGQKAPDFELASTQGGKFKLSELAGKKNVIIQFYVLDFTPT